MNTRPTPTEAPACTLNICRANSRSSWRWKFAVSATKTTPMAVWKREQLGGGYDFTVWLEKTALEMAEAVIAVSGETRSDIQRLFNVRPERSHVIYNGIDLDEYRPTPADDVLRRFRIDRGKPFLLFVGRITRQKGIIHLMHAIEFMDKDFQVVL